MVTSFSSFAACTDMTSSLRCTHETLRTLNGAPVAWLRLELPLTVYSPGSMRTAAAC